MDFILGLLVGCLGFLAINFIIIKYLIIKERTYKPNQTVPPPSNPKTTMGMKATIITAPTEEQEMRERIIQKHREKGEDTSLDEL